MKTDNFSAPAGGESKGAADLGGGAMPIGPEELRAFAPIAAILLEKSDALIAHWCEEYFPRIEMASPSLKEELRAALESALKDGMIELQALDWPAYLRRIREFGIRMAELGLSFEQVTLVMNAWVNVEFADIGTNISSLESWGTIERIASVVNLSIAESFFLTAKALESSSGTAAAGMASKQRVARSARLDGLIGA